MPLASLDATLDRRAAIGPQAQQLLRRAIISARLPPGLPLSENELAARLGVSRTPVREALGRLAEEGLVDVFPQYGTFVAPIRLAEVLEARFIREALECAVIREAAASPRPDLVRRLRRLIEEQTEAAAGRDLDAFLDRDEDFHRAFSEATGHLRVWKVTQGEKYQMDRIRFLSLPRIQSLPELIDQHGAMVDAVEAGDVDAAEAVMRRHLRAIFKAIEELSESQPELFAERDERPARALRPAG